MKRGIGKTRSGVFTGKGGGKTKQKKRAQTTSNIWKINSESYYAVFT